MNFQAPSKIGVQPETEAAPRTDCIAGKQSSKIDHVQLIAQIGSIHLQIHGDPLVSVEFSRCGRIE